MKRVLEGWEEGTHHGTPWVYTLYMPPPYCTTLGIPLPYHPLPYTLPYTPSGTSRSDEALGSSLRLITKGSAGRPLLLKSVKSGIYLCARLLSVSPTLNVKDWIADGSSMGYTLGRETSAQSGASLSPSRIPNKDTGGERRSQEAPH